MHLLLVIILIFCIILLIKGFKLLLITIGKNISKETLDDKELFHLGFMHFLKYLKKYSIIAIVLLILIVAGIGLNEYYQTQREKKIRQENYLAQIEMEKKTLSRLDSLRIVGEANFPNPTSDQLKAVFLNYKFEDKISNNSTSIDIQTLQDIISLHLLKSTKLDSLMELVVNGEFIVNKPKPGYHFKGDFALQYLFNSGDKYKDPQWELQKIVIINTKEVENIKPIIKEKKISIFSDEDE